MDFITKTEEDSDTASVFSSQDSNVKAAKRDTVENRKAVDHSLFILKRNYWLGLGMHMFLVLIHITLIAVLFAGHLENRISVPLGRPANIASVLIVVVTQVANQVFLVSMVLIVQQLALRRTLHIRQTLTAVHDQYNAWAGFGAACFTLLKQYHLPVSVWSIAAVTGYLLAISVLHITVPATFSLATFNRSIAGLAYMRSNKPDFTSFGVYTGLDDAASFLPMMGTLSNTNTTIGLFENMIFDSVETALETEWPGRALPIYSDFEAPAIAFHVDCGLVDNAVIRQNGISTGDSWNVTFDVGENPLLPINVARDQDVISEATIKWLAPFAIRFLPLNGEVSYQTALFYASVNVTDDRGRTGTKLDLDPAMKIVDEARAPSLPFNTWNPTIFACNMHTETRNVTLDARNGNISHTTNLSRTVRTTWEQWEQPQFADELNADALTYAWQAIFKINSRSTIPAKWCDLPWEGPDSNGTCKYNDFLTVPEKFLNDRLNIRLANGNSDTKDITVSLGDLEMALEDMTAAIFWSAANFVVNNRELDDTSYFPQVTANRIPVLLFDPAAQLNLNITPLLVGFLASITLLVIFLMIIRNPSYYRDTVHAEMTMTGFLQLVWLLGRGSSAQDRIAEVNVPTTDNLRKAAKFEVCMDTFVRQHDMDSPGPRCRLRNSGLGSHEDFV